MKEIRKFLAYARWVREFSQVILTEETSKESTAVFPTIRVGERTNLTWKRPKRSWIENTISNLRRKRKKKLWTPSVKRIINKSACQKKGDVKYQEDT